MANDYFRFLALTILGILIFLIIGALFYCHYTSNSKTFYGIKTTSDKVCFLIDISSSMGDLVYLNDDEKQYFKVDRNYISKLEMAKFELISVIKGLRGRTKFNIIGFEDSLIIWEKTMVSANNENKRSAINFVSNLKPDGRTGMNMAFNYVFTLAGEGVKELNKPVNIDTIFLLSDGMPTDVENAEVIVDNIDIKNSLRKISINVVDVGKGEITYFLKNITDRNSGKYVKR